VFKDDLIRFARRDWAAVARVKASHWLGQKRTQSTADVYRRADALLRHARTATRREPSHADRLADLNVHQRVGEALRAVPLTAR
jgi:hypothetical protein